MTDYQTLLVSTSPTTTRVRLNHAESRNSLSERMLADLHLMLDEAERSPGCRVVVIEGIDDVFCTGMDFTEAIDDSPDRHGSAESFFALLRRFTTIPRTVISKVDGRVSGGGVGLAAASDLVVAGPNAVFSLPEALWGLLPCCVLPFLIRRVGFQKAYAMMLTTQPVTAGQAQTFHLVDEVSTEPDTVIRRIGFRAAKLTEATVADAKRYGAQLWPITPEMESLAVRELNRLLATAEVKAAIGGFVDRQEFPWNRPRAVDGAEGRR